MLRLEIDGSWEPEDFVDVLSAVESLYFKAISQERLARPYYFDEMLLGSYRRFHLLRGDDSLPFEAHLDDANRFLLDLGRRTLPARKRIRINRLRYASPGSIDFAGIGKAFECIEGIIDRLIRFFTERELRRQGDAQARIQTEMLEIERDERYENLRELKIANATRLLELSERYPDMPRDMLIALVGRDQDKLIERIAEGKLTAVKQIEARSSGTGQLEQ